MDPDAQTRLSDWIAREAGGEAVRITGLAALTGGAIQENWALDIEIEGGDWPGKHELVLRRDAPSSVAASHSRAEEFALLKAAHKAGVVVPRPCVLCEDTSVLGSPFFVMHRARGEARGHRLVKLPPSRALVHELGSNLAKIHTIQPPRDELGFLTLHDASPALQAIDDYRGYLDGLPDPHPAIEWGLRWLEDNAPAPSLLVLCQRDYRTGNLMIEDGKLTATLDWEFAAWSDPLEDIGWFLATCWRFGRWEEEAGGLGPREAFYEGYEEASGRTIERDAIHYWEVMSHVRWAVIALQQADRFVTQGEQNIELALTAHVAPELEMEILRMTEPGP